MRDVELVIDFPVWEMFGFCFFLFGQDEKSKAVGSCGVLWFFSEGCMIIASCEWRRERVPPGSVMAALLSTGLKLFILQNIGIVKPDEDVIMC